MAEYLSPRPQAAYDPFLLRGMEEAVGLILAEIDKGTRICLYGDYDADGVTSVCILYTFLRNLTDDIFYYIPSRFVDGYGLNNAALESIKDKGAGLVITVDCGSVSYEEVEYAKSIGLKIIVTDHHTIDTVKADCILINPKQQDCPYPFKDLAGCGVAFKLAQAIRIRKGLPRETLNNCLDFVAIGTVADIVPLRDENRTMVKYGLMKINQADRMSIRTLVKGISLDHVYAENISFGIAPHINAAGRMGSATDAVKLFLAEDEETARIQTQALKDANYKRRSLQEAAFDDCISDIQEDEDFAVLYKGRMHEGISGIVAGKIKEETGRPCVIMTDADGQKIKGTGRSIDTIDLHDFLKEFSDLFYTFGGHKGACGFTLPRENMQSLIEGIREKIKKIRREHPETFEKKEDYDLALSPGEVSLGLYEQLRSMEPFGEGNRRPVFALRGVTLSQIRYMGEEAQHVKFQAAEGSDSLECILFNKADRFRSLLADGEKADIIGRVETNTWRGNTKIQFRVEDIVR